MRHSYAAGQETRRVALGAAGRKLVSDPKESPPTLRPGARGLGGAEGGRTLSLLIANQALSH